MVTPTQKDPVDPIKVIAIKMPFDLQERFLSFPFLHALRELHPLADIHFITPKKYIEVLNLLPFKAYYHEFDEDEITSVFNVYRFTAHAKIYNVDLFISLTNSFVDACLGLGLRAKTRLGFSDGWKTLLFNEKTKRPVGHHLCEDFFSLFQVHAQTPVQERLRVMSRELQPVVIDWDTLPYFAINISPLRNAGIEEEWVQLINCFENQRIILFASEEQEKAQLSMETFIAKLSKKNIYTNFIYKSQIDVAKMVAYSRGLLTFNGPAASMAGYVGSKALVLYDSEDPRRTGPFYFLSDVLVLAGNDPSVVNSVTTTLGLRNRIMFDMEKVASKAYEFFKLGV